MQGVRVSQYSLDPLPRCLSCLPSMVFHTVRFSSSDFLKELAHYQVMVGKKVMQECDVKLPRGVGESLPFLSQLLRYSPDEVGLKAAAAPNIPRTDWCGKTRNDI